MNLNARTKTTKLLERNKGITLHDFELGNDFLNMVTKA